ncbi:hypothetical protein [uncultured Stenotrophomonas sp.]|uniref:Rz1-like lysis system protein LysC n=1 Tax=uncultured Stenotrophomonas sp. TaxID=165438 RepID=UPI0025D13F60|nr:hypothetical protein [uncultured Stenotrophomonas sp.]
MPTIVRIPVERKMSLPSELTQGCSIARPADRTLLQLVAAYNTNILALEQCNRQLQAIRALHASQREH